MPRTRSAALATTGTVLRLVRDGAASTRSEIAALTGLSRTAVTTRLATLVDAGLVLELEDNGAGVGRPPARLVFNTAAGIVLAVAVGRSRTQIAVLDLGGRIIGRRDIEQEVAPGPDSFMPRIVRELSALVRKSGYAASAVRGIGLSIPGTVNPRTLSSHGSPIMAGWEGVRLSRYFDAFTPAPVLLENDTNVIALAERNAHLASVADALIVKASTGLGAGIVAGGVLQHGSVGAAGEIGHVKYAPAQALQCRCCETGCLEAIAGGWAIVRAMNLSSHRVEHIRDVVALAVDGDLEARDRIRDSGRHFGTVLAAAVTLLNPTTIVVGGDMAPAYDVFVAGLRETLYRDASTIATRDLGIVAATFGAESGVLGCATLVLDHIFSAAVLDESFA